MRIELDDAKRGPVAWNETLDLEVKSLGTSGLGDLGVVALEAIEHSGEFTYSEPNYRLRGELSYRQELSCYRCLVEFAEEVGDDFEYVLERSAFRADRGQDADSGDMPGHAPGTVGAGETTETANGDDPGLAGVELELHTDDLEMLSIDTDHIDTTSYIREQVLLHVPMKALCRVDCKGLCSQCGKDLNASSCDCSPEPSDPRWAGLSALKSQLDG